MAVAGALRACRRVVLYGFSMGSYGALISARVLGADRLVLMAPVADIPPDRDRRWIGVYDQRTGPRSCRGPERRWPVQEILTAPLRAYGAAFLNNGGILGSIAQALFDPVVDIA